MSELIETTWLESAKETIEQKTSIGEIVIDLSNVNRIRSHELNELIRLQMLAKKYGNCLVLLNPQAIISEVLTLTRLDRLIHLRCDLQHKLPAPHFVSR